VWRAYKDNKISTVWNILLTGDKMSNDLAFAINKIIVDHKADLITIQGGAVGPIAYCRRRRRHLQRRSRLTLWQG
jgi:hypothetical protein